jgi:hypothetical protein
VKSLAWNIETLNKLSVAGSHFMWSAAAEQEYEWVKKQMKESGAHFSLLFKTSSLYTNASA